MARAAGVPSRVVLGFTPGDQRGNGEVIVRDKNAHAWVELWIPTQGWVQFDPTPRGDGVNPRTYNALEADIGFPVTAYLEQIPEPPVPDVARSRERPSSIPARRRNARCSWLGRARKRQRLRHRPPRLADHRVADRHPRHHRRPHHPALQMVEAAQAPAPSRGGRHQRGVGGDRRQTHRPGCGTRSGPHSN